MLGDAVYDIPGLTFQGSLVEFLRDQGTIERQVYEGFRVWLRYHSQGNGNFFRRLEAHPSSTGIVWPPAMQTKR